MGRHTKPSPTLPTNWPSSPRIVFTNSPIYSSHLTTAQIQVIHSPPPDPKTQPPGTPPSPIESVSHVPPVSILPITDPLHPAHPQSGLFATSHLPPSSFICLYTGYVHNDCDNSPHSDYDLSMDRNAGLAIDATHMGNEARFVNDYRGVPGREDRGPNAEFRDCWVKLVRLARKGWDWERRVGVYVLPAGRSGKRKEGVKRGEEILVSYGKGFWCKARGEDGSVEEKPG